MTDNINGTNNKIYQSLSKFLSNPINSLIIGVLITLSVFFFIERKEIEPRYFVSNIEPIAEQLPESTKLELFWDGEKIPNIKSVKIAIWNNGKQYLSNDNISETEPIQIIIPDGIKVLNAEFIQTSRTNLKFKTTLLPDGENVKFVRVDIEGDEALENHDGGVLKIFFTGEPKDNFIVSGRIFGSKSGFVNPDSQIPLPIQNLNNIPVTIFVIFTYIYVTVFLYRILKKDELRSKIFILFMFILSGTVILFLLYFGILNQLPSWIL